MRMGLYRAILRYMTQQAITTIFIGILVSSLAMALSGFFLNAFLPRSVPIIYIFTTLILIGMPRLMFRHVMKMLVPKGHENVIIYGAGQSGNNLAYQLQLSGEFNPVAFIDDNAKLNGSMISGLSVYSPEKISQLVENFRATRILLALGNISRHEKVRIIRFLEPLGLQVQTIPPITDIVKGIARINQLRSIEIEDLLGREPVAPDELLLRQNVENKVILVTGAGGSIGSELCRQLLKLNPKQLILFERNEFNLYRIERELTEKKLELDEESKVDVVALLGSINGETHVNMVLKQFAVDTLFHAAAYKHVPIVEHNLIEGVKNNFLGTHVLAKAAIKHKVKNFVLISSDKAVRPTNVMGATKRLAEILLQNMAKETEDTIFSMVRFGNVLGSSGSVVPLFKQQIAAGGPVTITHKDVVRYFMTITEAAQLVIQSTAMAKTGDLFVLDMGEPVKIIDLVRDMALLSGHSIKDENNPEGDIEIKIIGLRPGEKLYEELLCDDNCEGTSHPRIWRAHEPYIGGMDFKNLLLEVQRCCEEYKHQELIRLLEQANIGFKPDQYISDSLYIQQKKIGAQVIPINRS